MATLLLVEDDQGIRELLADLLGLEGYEVRVASNGIEALKQLDVAFPQLVISDLDMPALDGQALIYRMFVENLGRENIPVILMSGSPRLPDIALAVGTRYAIAKPFTSDALMALVERALAEACPPRPRSPVAPS